MNIDMQKLISDAFNNDADAQLDLGNCYLRGWNVDIDYEKAVMWYKKAAANGSEKAIYNLGLCYGDGLGVEQEIPRAFEFYKQAADRGFPDAIYKVGLFYLEGLAVESNQAKAFQYIKKAAEFEIPLALHDTGACYANGWGVEQDIEIAKNYFIKAARCDKVDGKCRYIVGNYFLSGIYFEQDEKKGFFWIESAALIDYADAIVRLGELYYDGVGCKKNIDKARICWEKAAEAKVPDAILKLSICYEMGECGFPISASRASELCLEAAELGSSEAQMKCALSFLTCEEPTEEDYQKAFAWLEKANALNNGYAKYFLAGFYYQGIVVKESAAKALELYKEAYDLGVFDAASDIVSCYKYGGNDLTANVSMAKKYASEYEVDYDEV